MMRVWRLSDDVCRVHRACAAGRLAGRDGAYTGSSGPAAALPIAWGGGILWRPPAQFVLFSLHKFGFSCDFDPSFQLRTWEIWPDISDQIFHDIAAIVLLTAYSIIF